MACPLSLPRFRTVRNEAWTIGCCSRWRWQPQRTRSCSPSAIRFGTVEAWESGNLHRALLSADAGLADDGKVCSSCNQQMIRCLFPVSERSKKWQSGKLMDAWTPAPGFHDPAGIGTHTASTLMTAVHFSSSLSPRGAVLANLVDCADLVHGVAARRVATALSVLLACAGNGRQRSGKHAAQPSSPSFAVALRLAARTSKPGLAPRS